MATIAVKNNEVGVLHADPGPKRLADGDSGADAQQREDVRLGVEGLLPLGGANGLFRQRLAGDLLTGDDVKADVAASAREIAHHRAVEQLEPSRARGFPDDHLGDVVGLRKGDHVVGDPVLAAWNGDLLAAERLSEPQRVGDPVALLLGQLQAPFGLDIERRPRRVQAIGEALGVAHQPGRAGVLADADKQTVARRPRA